MGVLNSSRKAMKGFIEKSYSMGQLHGEMKKINDPRRQNLIETVHLTKAEENKIDTLFVSKLVDCLEKCLIYGHIRRFAN